MSSFLKTLRGFDSIHFQFKSYILIDSGMIQLNINILNANQEWTRLRVLELAFNFVIVSKKGKENKVVDALSS